MVSCLRPSFGRYQVITYCLITRAGTRVWTTCPESSYAAASWPGIELVTSWSQVRRPTIAPHSYAENRPLVSRVSNLMPVTLLILAVISLWRGLVVNWTCFGDEHWSARFCHSLITIISNIDKRQLYVPVARLWTGYICYIYLFTNLLWRNSL